MISFAHAQTAGAASPGGFDSNMLIMMVIMIAVMFFMTARQQQKKAKEQRELLEKLAKGDEVLTQGGIVGRIVKIGDNYITLEISKSKDASVEMLVQKQAITMTLPPGSIKNQ